MKKLPSVWLISVGGSLGSIEVPVEKLAEKFKTTALKITELTGVRRLFRLGHKENLVDMAVTTALKVVKNVGILPSEICGVFGSSNPTTEKIMPTFTTSVASKLGVRDSISDHIGLGCGGAMQAMRIAYNQLVVDALRGKWRNYLIVTGDRTSWILDPEDWQTALLFSEGVSVVLMTNNPMLAKDGYEIERIGTKSLLGDELETIILENPYDPSRQKVPMFKMKGKSVYGFGSRIVSHFLRLLELRGFPSRNCYLIPHQPNLRLLKSMAKYARIPEEKMYMDGIQTIGNTSPAAFLLGLEDALRRNLFDPADDVILGTFGAELQVGAAYLHPWGDPKKILC